MIIVIDLHYNSFIGLNVYSQPPFKNPNPNLCKMNIYFYSIKILISKTRCRTNFSWKRYGNRTV